MDSIDTTSFKYFLHCVRPYSGDLCHQTQQRQLFCSS